MSLDLILTPAIKTQCKNCSACCIGLLVELSIEDYDLWEEYNLLDELIQYTEINPDESNRWNYEFVLKQKEDGSCVFLCNGFCTIYEVRPEVCRAFEYQGKCCHEFRKRCGLEEEEF